jgi:hypothetical protein
VLLCRVNARLFARWMDFWWGYDVIHNYLLTGHFTWYVPTVSNVSGGFDCFGKGVGAGEVIHNYLLTGRFTWYVPTVSGFNGDGHLVQRALTMTCSS